MSNNEGVAVFVGELDVPLTEAISDLKDVNYITFATSPPFSGHVEKLHVKTCPTGQAYRCVKGCVQFAISF